MSKKPLRPAKDGDHDAPGVDDVTEAGERLFEIADGLADDAAIYHKEARRLMVGKDAPNRIARRLYQYADDGRAAGGRVRALCETFSAITLAEHERRRQKKREESRRWEEARAGERGTERDYYATPQAAASAVEHAELKIANLHRGVALIEAGRGTPALVKAMQGQDHWKFYEVLHRFKDETRRPGGDNVVTLH